MFSLQCSLQRASATGQECSVVIVMEILGSADVEPDLRDFPVIPVQLAIFITLSARVSQDIPFQQAYPKIQICTLYWEMKFFWQGDVFIRNSPKTCESKKKKKNVMRSDSYLKMPLLIDCRLFYDAAVRFQLMYAWWYLEYQLKHFCYLSFILFYLILVCNLTLMRRGSLIHQYQRTVFF